MLKRSLQEARDALVATFVEARGRRAVLDLTGSTIVLGAVDGELRAVILGDNLDDALRRLKDELPAGTLVDCVLPARFVTLKRCFSPPGSSFCSFCMVLFTRVFGAVERNPSIS